MNAKHVVVVDDATGNVLMARDAAAIVPIASLTKLMTAMVIPMRASARPSDSASVMTMWTGSSTARVLFAWGTELSRQDALELALVSSDNRAASSAGATYPGGESAFVQAPQAKVRALGLRNTSQRAHGPVAAEHRYCHRGGPHHWPLRSTPEIARITSSNAPPWP